MISVVIVTKNRPYDIENISLRSLIKQDCSAFEVLIWDASSNEETEKACSRLKDPFLDKNVELKYCKAPRTGIPSQRNDALKEIQGDVVFFIDDDSEVSENGVRLIAELFERNHEVMGAGLPLVDLPRGCDDNQSSKVTGSSFKLRLCSGIRYVKKRRVNIAGSAKGASSAFPEAQWLSGGSMAYRKSVFEDMKFNEVLETFGPYATCEDVEFSHRVYRKYKVPLVISDRGKVIHRPAPGSRVSDTRSWIACLVFNRFHVLKAASGSLFWFGFAGYMWSMIRLFCKMSRKHGLSTTYAGFKLAICRMRR